jgi:uncharacterized protein
VATRRLRVEWISGSKVTALLTGHGEGSVAVLLAHGAGAGQRHPFMAGMRSRLAGNGLSTMSFDYPYMEAERRAPDRLPRLLECHAAAFDRLTARFDSVVVAGKSMGGRVGGHLVAAVRPGGAALVFYGYPLVPIGASQPRDASHLVGMQTPMLFIQGERDRMGPPDLIRPIANAATRAALTVVPDADHGFNVPKRTGLTPNDILDQLATETATFIADL